MVKWFIMQKEHIAGPYSTDEVRAKVAEGSIAQNSFIWGRPQDAWQNINWWMKESALLTQNHQSEISEQKWHLAIEGDSKGPYTRQELINQIKALRNKSDIMIWTKGMKAWADLYEFHDLLDEVGLNKREHPRATIHGTVTIRYEDKTLIGVLKTISPGGFGAAQLDSQIPIGQLVLADIKSDTLNETITVKANVQYNSETGYYGFKFSGINMESKALILEYIRSNKSAIDTAA